MKTVLLDSSVWIEILMNGAKKAKCERVLHSAKTVVVPTVVLFEVYRKIRRSVGEDEGLLCVSWMRGFQSVDLTTEVALSAADYSAEYSLAMADSFVLAHARKASAVLVTLDNDFRTFEGVQIP